MKFLNYVRQGMTVAAAASLLASPVTSLAADYSGSDPDMRAANKLINDKVLYNIPYLFNMPKSAHKDIGSINNSDIVFDFVKPGQEKVGLKLYIVKEDLDGREKLTKRLKSAGLLEDGDVILTYHPEWGNTGPYPSVMTGISHAGMVYTDGNVVRNIDMPLNQAQNLDIRNNRKKSTLSSDHYVKHAEYIHILRAKNLSRDQKSNLNKWAVRFANRVRGYGSTTVYGGGKNQTIFNGNYLAPAYAAMKGFPNVEVGSHAIDLARLGTDRPIQNLYLTPAQDGYSQNLPLFCSDFVWSLHALRDCDPDRFNGNNCTANPLFPPMPLVGQFQPGSEGDFSKYSPGLTDAAFIMMSASGVTPQNLSKKVDVVMKASVGMRNISSGHKKAAAAIPATLYAGVAKYWEGFYQSKFAIAGGAVDQGNAGLQQALAGAAKINFLNTPEAAQMAKTNPDIMFVPKNYSPTTFLVNAMLPDANPNKKYDYVATIALLNNNTYKQVKRAVENPAQATQAAAVASSASSDNSALAAIKSTAGYSGLRYRCVELGKLYQWAECKDMADYVRNGGNIEDLN